MKVVFSVSSWLLLFMLFTHALMGQPAFPGAEGFGAVATGGRGGQVIYVTNLNVSGPGSLADALNQDGPRYILFKVSGVIPGTVVVPPGKGNFTLAGQTSPGGIVVRGFEMYNGTEATVSNVIVRHLRSRIGDAQKFPTPHWLGGDGITIGGVHRAIFDHCSFEHATDEAVDISRSSQITIQNCILGETLGAHAVYGGMLINYSDAASRLDSLSIHHNVWCRIGGRMPEISCESPYCADQYLHLELSDNLIWDPQIELWYEGTVPPGDNFYLHMNAVNNLFVARPAFGNAMFHHDLLHFAQNQLYFSGNKLNLYPSFADYQLFHCCNDFPNIAPNSDFGIATQLTQRLPFPVINYTPTDMLQNYLSGHCGAFPRDSMDRRMFSYLINNQIIQLPVDEAAADDAFIPSNSPPSPTDSDQDGMPDYWEAFHGLDNAYQDHNGTQLSATLTGINGYTNLECYLNCLADALVLGYSPGNCGIQLAGTTGSTTPEADWLPHHAFAIVPNPGSDRVVIRCHFALPSCQQPIDVRLFSLQGTEWVHRVIAGDASANHSLNIEHLPSGMYLCRISHTGTKNPHVEWLRFVKI